ncbi:hypothetical protein RD110_08145 [Rhodoferax koreense]|uniref:Holin n=1 Tax=Rhodoferax koreensis TaxID=1842727 RepID=A0A1P8JTU5_9BURK|nr:holin [Rhodoferax koreense]APW37174.1 hypothetical protein RD110_08145 [Rhodoferax koreense]
MNTPAEAATAGIASKVTTGGGTVAFIAGFSSHEFIAWAGLGVAVAGLLMNLAFKLEARQRAKREHAARMRRLERMLSSDTDMVSLGEDD